MTSRSGRGRWQRVLAARHQARAELGGGPPGGDMYPSPPKPRKALSPPPPAPTPVEGGPGVLVLSLGEAAVRLGVSRAELEAMIDAGTVVALGVGGVGRVVPTSEVVRLRR